MMTTTMTMESTLSLRDAEKSFRKRIGSKRPGNCHSLEPNQAEKSSASWKAMTKKATLRKVGLFLASSARSQKGRSLWSKKTSWQKNSKSSSRRLSLSKTMSARDGGWAEMETNLNPPSLHLCLLIDKQLKTAGRGRQVRPLIPETRLKRATEAGQVQRRLATAGPP